MGTVITTPTFHKAVDEFYINLLSTCAPSIVLGAGDIAVNKKDTRDDRQ